jgi:hypothetical protein
LPHIHKVCKARKRSGGKLLKIPLRRGGFWGRDGAAKKRLKKGENGKKGKKGAFLGDFCVIGSKIIEICKKKFVSCPNNV